MNKDKHEFITKEVKEALKDALTELKDVVAIEIYTKIGINDMFNDFAVELVTAMSGLTDKIKLSLHTVGDESSKKRNVLRSPTVLIAPDKYDIRYTGAPAGEEVRSMVLTVIMASTGRTLLSDDSRKRLERLREKRRVRIFVSPT